MTAPLIEVSSLSKDYTMGGERIRALREVTTTVQRGEIVAVMGPSGSGKSTFMNLLGCLDRPTAGSYKLDGDEVAALEPDAQAKLRNSRIGFVFQSFNLLPRATALANVELPLVYAGVDRRTRRQRALAALHAVGLSARVHHRPTELSGGQQQRVAIARALVNDPVLMLADEPTGALDSHTSLEIIALLQRLNRSGVTIVLVTHEPDVAKFAGRVLAFHDGKLRSDRAQTPEDAAAALAATPGIEEAA